jgi:MazG family protein
MDLFAASAEFIRLVEIMVRLRAPDGCPWDREQTIDTLKRYVLEETYELIDAIDRHDHESLREELGDFLFQAVFIAQLEQEAGHFSIGDAMKAIADKLVRRHPHVFERESGAAALDTANQVRARWEEIKAQERDDRKKPATTLSSIPAALPSLARTHQIGARAASVGFDWERASDVIAKIREEVDEVAETLAAGESPERVEEEMGDLLFAIANLSRKLHVDPEAALRKANNKFTARFTAMETAITQSGRRLQDLAIDKLEEEWQKIKRTE